MSYFHGNNDVMHYTNVHPTSEMYLRYHHSILEANCDWQNSHNPQNTYHSDL